MSSNTTSHHSSGGNQGQDKAQSGSPLRRSSRRKSAGAFRTISEVADELGVQQHVLRFWETKFSQVRPLKRGGGRRYYRPEDIELLKSIHHLLYTEGYTIKGVQKLLREQGKNQVLDGAGRTTPIPEPANQAAPSIQEDAKAEKPALANDAGSEAEHEAAPENTPENGNLSDRQRMTLQAMLGELKELRRLIAE